MCKRNESDSETGQWGWNEWSNLLIESEVIEISSCREPRHVKKKRGGRGWGGGEWMRPLSNYFRPGFVEQTIRPANGRNNEIPSARALSLDNDISWTRNAILRRLATFFREWKGRIPVKEGGATRTMPGAKIEETSHVFVEERDLFWKGAIERPLFLAKIKRFATILLIF